MSEFANALWSFLISLCTWALDGCLWILKKAAFVLMDGLLTCISSIFTAIDLSSIASNYALQWANVPTQLIWFVNAISLPAGITIIVAAIGIRMLINLIPAAFTRI